MTIDPKNPLESVEHYTEAGEKAVKDLNLKPGTYWHVEDGELVFDKQIIQLKERGNDMSSINESLNLIDFVNGIGENDCWDKIIKAIDRSIKRKELPYIEGFLSHVVNQMSDGVGWTNGQVYYMLNGKHHVKDEYLNVSINSDSSKKIQAISNRG